jgi:hypothetical protein
VALSGNSTRCSSPGPTNSWHGPRRDETPTSGVRQGVPRSAGPAPALRSTGWRRRSTIRGNCSDTASSTPDRSRRMKSWA